MCVYSAVDVRKDCVMSCDSKPCLNGGVCKEDFQYPDNFRCDCSGTSYTGSVCNSGEDTETALILIVLGLMGQRKSLLLALHVCLHQELIAPHLPLVYRDCVHLPWPGMAESRVQHFSGGGRRRDGAGLLRLHQTRQAPDRRPPQVHRP